MRDTKRAGELLGSMEEAVHRLVTDAPGHPWGGGPGHNEARRGEILEAARGLAELAGYTGIALGEGAVILAGDGDERVEGELLGIAGAAWRIRGEPDREAGQDWEGFREEQGAVREAILECHDRIRRATGCGDGDPIVPIGELGNALEAMGVAMFHIGSAFLDYEMIAEWPEDRLVRERFRHAGHNARLAHRVLHHISESGIAYQHEVGLGPEIRKYSRMAKVWLTRARVRAAEAIGEEVPGETDDLHAPELDGRRTE